MDLHILSQLPHTCVWVRFVGKNRDKTHNKQTDGPWCDCILNYFGHCNHLLKIWCYSSRLQSINLSDENQTQLHPETYSDPKCTNAQWDLTEYTICTSQRNTKTIKHLQHQPIISPSTFKDKKITWSQCSSLFPHVIRLENLLQSAPLQLFNKWKTVLFEGENVVFTFSGYELSHLNI